MENKWEIQVKDVYNSWTSINFDVNQFILSMALLIMFICCYFWIIYKHMKITLNGFFLCSFIFQQNSRYFMHCGKLLHFLNILTSFFLFVVINVWCFFIQCVYWVSHLCYVENLFVGFLLKERHTWKCNS